ncbi:hypothetical protein BDP27DRAFT_34792, partial [Rhodocollybia butyracea]
MLMVTQPVWYERYPDEETRRSNTLSEGEQDALVKDWLIAGGVVEEQLGWIWIW